MFYRVATQHSSLLAAEGGSRRTLEVDFDRVFTHNVTVVGSVRVSTGQDVISQENGDRSVTPYGPIQRLVIVAIAVLSCALPQARAGSIILDDSGWEAIWDSSLDGLVDVTVDSVTANAVFIEKSAEFTGAPGPGGFPSIAIVFRQIAADAVPQIVISDEIIVNSTGVDWTDFHMEVIDSGDAHFNPTLTDASGFGGGFSTSPFDHQAFGDGETSFWTDGFGLAAGGGDAIVEAGAVWFPGIGPGELYIDVTPRGSAPFTLFTLKETPTPEPATCLLMLVGAGILTRRRKNGG